MRYLDYYATQFQLWAAVLVWSGRPAACARSAARRAGTPAILMCAGTSMPSARESERRATMATLRPRRLALKYSPPTVILEYSGDGGFLHYKVHLRNLERGMDADKITRKVFAKHGRYFDPEKVRHSQVKKLVERLLSRAGPPASGLPPPPPASSLPPPKPFPGQPGFRRPADERLLNGAVDLNTVSERDLAHAKSLMTADFRRHQALPGDDGYEYDKSVEFEDAEEDCDWDD